MIGTEQIAQVAHEVNRAYCEALGDHSQLSWHDAPQWQRESAISGVELHSGTEEISASASHEAWMAEKIADGWKYGPVKDAAKKEHPCIIPFNGLPVEQQAKDYIFRAVVRAILDVFGE